MRVIIQTWGSTGDVHPFVGLGRELQARGHEVFLLANEEFGGMVQGAGLNWIEDGDAATFHRMLDNPDLGHPRKGLSVLINDGVAPALRPTYDRIVALLEPGSTLLVAGAWGLSAHLVAETHRVPLVMTQLQPIAFRSVHRAPRFPGLTLPDGMQPMFKRAAYWLMDRIVDPIMAPPLNDLRKTLGLAPVRRIFQDWIHESDLRIGLFPDWFAPAQPDWPDVLLTDFPFWDPGDNQQLDEDLERWLDAGEPPIVFTPGSGNAHGADFFAASIEAAGNLGRRALIATTYADQVPPLPPHAHHSSFPPFSELFPRCAAVVHHGGIGTTSLALAAGRPALVAAIAFDQFDNGSRLVDTGLGDTLPMRRYSASRATAALDRLLHDDAVMQACQEAGRRLSPRTGLHRAAEAIGRLGVQAGITEAAESAR